MKNVFIQIGLNSACEYACLAYPDTRDRVKQLNPKYIFPSEILDVKEPYTVIGVEMNPLKAEYNRKVHQDNPNVHIWTYCIWHENIENFEHGDYVAVDEYLPEGGTHKQKFIGSAIMFETLVEKIKQLDRHQDAAIKGLHVNIEGSEMNLFQSIHWNQFSIPWVRVACEHYNTVHTEKVNKKSQQIVRNLMETHGYCLTPHPIYDKDEFLTFTKG